MQKWDGLNRFLIGEKVTIELTETYTMRNCEILEYDEIGLLYGKEDSEVIGFIPWTSLLQITKRLEAEKSMEEK